MPLYLTEADVTLLLKPRDLTDALEATFRGLARGEAVQLPRFRVRHDKQMLHTLPGLSQCDGVAGVKTYLSGPSGARFVTLLFGLESGALEAVVESDRLGQLRTGCATALSARYLAPPGPLVMGLLGAGTVAWGQLEALACEVPLAEVRVFSRSADRREDFCRRATESLGVRARPAGSAAEAVRQAGLVVTATWTRHPLLSADMLAPVCHVCPVGSNKPDRREVDEEVVRGADLVVVDDLASARTEAGDLLAVPDLDWSTVQTLADLVLAGRQDRPDRTLFKSVGVALEDLSAAALAVRRARQQGLGQSIG
jgi:ornithine cyclodeaminase/alanine dehydrogenase-like protein (mu-crystallin family)